MQYLQQPSTHRHHVQPAHQTTHSLHHGASAPFGNGSGGSTLLGQHLRTAAHRNNAAAGVNAFPGSSAAHANSDAFQPSLCKSSCLFGNLFTSIVSNMRPRLGKRNLFLPNLSFKPD